MRSSNVLLLWVIFFTVSCKPAIKNEEAKKDAVLEKKSERSDLKAGLPEFSLASITSDFNAYWIYHYQNVKLYRNFLATDEHNKPISKTAFLVKLTKGKFLPLLMHSPSDTPHYKLAGIPASILKDAGAVIAAYGKRQLGYFKMERKPIPEFSFKDVNGVEYSSENTKGKIVLFKCWFIGCVACVTEMPELNKMVEKYKNRNDILFISLAIDDKKPLQKFLTKTKFEYVTVPNQEEYMTEKLKVNAYPTHFLIDKNGILVKTVDTETEISEVLEQLAAQ